ncbi:MULTISPECIES: hypothetical protein [unclassified Bradyrhizobium]|uniref:hypothetical protein n=1 Tax=unclassified Bradyrhizobium TaxID=2631580 RepID=UPI0028E9196D|nr:MULTISPECIES: hypothetical protein [unclassified Bradyrhizobium]
MTASDVSASSVLQISFSEMSRKADFIVQATPSGRRIELRDGVPWTCLVLDVSKTIKGSPDRRPELCFLGGKTTNGTLGVTDIFIPPEGREGVYFCYDNSRHYVSSLVGWQQGAFLVSRDLQVGSEVLTTSDGTPVADIQVSATPNPQAAAPFAAGVIPAQAGKTTTFVTTARLISLIHQALVTP